MSRVETTNGAYRRFLATVRELRLLKKGDSVLIGLSGGADSVSLLLLLKQIRDCEDPSLALQCAHVNPMLRGAEADEDEAFCRELCEQLAVPIHCTRRDIRRLAAEQGVGIEECARNERYRFLEETAMRIGAKKVALGHQADDNAETLIQRVARGTGTHGLIGIPPSRPISRGSRVWLVRPLIRVESSEIREYLKTISQSWRTDSSNLQAIHTRNRIRLRILPEMEKRFHPEIRHMLNRLAACARVIDSFAMQNGRELLADSRVSVSTGRAEFSAAWFESVPVVLRTEVLRQLLDKFGAPLGKFNQRHFTRLSSMLEKSKIQNPKCKIGLPGCVVRRRGNLIELRRTVESAEAPFPVDLKIPGVTELAEWSGRIEAEAIDGPTFDLRQFVAGKSAHEEVMDGERIEGAVRVRAWRFGDRFHPLGASGKKKLQDFFTDVKVPEGERRFIPIIEDVKGILWVVGFRLVERVRVTAQTRRILKMRFLRMPPQVSQD